MSWLNWYLNFAATNIYGFIPILALIYGIFFLLKMFFNRLPHPGIFVVIAFFLSLFIIPSIPRYTFERDIISKYKDSSEYKLVETANWGALIEPITLLKTPVGFFHFVSPDLISSGIYTQDNQGRFFSQIHRYDEPPVTQMVEAECSDLTISISEPRDGVYKYIFFNEQMTEYQKRIFCETDYSPQIEIYKCKFKILRQINEISDEAVIDANRQCTASEK